MPVFSYLVIVPGFEWQVWFVAILRIMKTHAQTIRLGIFIAVSLAILLFMVGFFTTQQFFRQEDIYYVAYRDVSVSGLEAGSQVKYLGIKVGVIRDISIESRDVNRIVVKLALKSGTPIKEDADANITALDGGRVHFEGGLPEALESPIPALQAFFHAGGMGQPPAGSA